MNYIPTPPTDEDRKEAERLRALGYRRTSSKHKLLSRIDRADWVTVLAAHLRRAPADLYILSQNLGAGYTMSDTPSGQWCDYYRRVLSNDSVEVSRAVATLVGGSSFDDCGYVSP